MATSGSTHQSHPICPDSWGHLKLCRGAGGHAVLARAWWAANECPADSPGRAAGLGRGGAADPRRYDKSGRGGRWHAGHRGVEHMGRIGQADRFRVVDSLIHLPWRVRNADCQPKVKAERSNCSRSEPQIMAVPVTIRLFSAKSGGQPIAAPRFNRPRTP